MPERILLNPEPGDPSGQHMALPTLKEVGLQKRFIHLVFDGFAAHTCYFIISMVILSISGNREAVYITDLIAEHLHPFILDMLEYLIPVYVYYFVAEWLYYGRTFGKWLTGSRAVQRDGCPLTMRHAFVRTLCRMVPLETISFLITSTGFWHDNWSNTIVIEGHS